MTRRGNGFTLVEVLVALALTALLMTAILLVVRSEIGLTTAVTDAGKGWESLRSLATMMNLQIASAAAPRRAEVSPFEGSPGDLTFLTTISRSGPTPQGRGIVQVTYRSGEGGRVFYRERLIPLPGGDPAEGGPGDNDQGAELSDMIERLSFVYVDDKGKEHDLWPPAETPEALLPAAVLVTMLPKGLQDEAVVVARINR